MKVLMLSKACIVGAYQKKLEEMAAYEDVELTVAVPPYWRDSRGVVRLERVHVKGYDLHVEDMALNGHFHVHYYPGLRRLVNEVRPDVFHIDEEPYNLATFQAMRLARKVGARSVVFAWQNILRRYPPPFSLMEWYVLRHADAVIVGNDEGEAVWRAKGYGGPIRVIPQFGVDPEIFKRHNRRKRESRLTILQRRSARRPSQPVLTIGYIGRLVPEKGLDVLFQAVSTLQGPWELRILGSGPEKERLEKMAQWLGIGARVTFDLPIPSMQIPYYLSGLDALVLPSIAQPNWKEQFGRVLVEAMACGVVTIGARSGAIPGVVGDAGLIFEEGNPENLHDQIQRILSDVELRRRLSEAGRERVLQKYTQQQVAAATVEVYRDVLAGS